MAEMRNLLTDPWPSRLSWGIVGDGDAANVELRMNAAQDGIYVRTIASPPAWIGLWVNGMTPGVEYVAAIYVNGAACTLLAKDRIDGPRLASHECTTSQTFHAIRFTPEGNRAIIAIIPPTTVNKATTINRFEVMSGKDFDTMRAIKNPDGTPANIRWFAPPKTAAAGVMSTPALDRGGGGGSPRARRHYPHWVVAA